MLYSLRPLELRFGVPISCLIFFKLKLKAARYDKPCSRYEGIGVRCLLVPLRERRLALRCFVPYLIRPLLVA